MSLEKCVDLFCKIFIELITDLEIMYPKDSSLTLLKLSVNGMILYNKRNFVDLVVEYLTPYNTQILQKNEDFFLNNLKDDLKIDDGYTFIEEEIKKICNIWKDPSTSLDTKECIWKYFNDFVKLGKLIKKTKK